LAILVNVGYPAAREELAQVQTAARALGLESAVLEIRRAEDIAPAFDGAKGRADALYVISEALVTANVVLITKLALETGLPSIYSNREFAVSGGLMAYGPSVPARFSVRRTSWTKYFVEPNQQTSPFSSRLNSTSSLISRAGKRLG
jgi:hypothetical protein